MPTNFGIMTTALVGGLTLLVMRRFVAKILLSICFSLEHRIYLTTGVAVDPCLVYISGTLVP